MSKKGFVHIYTGNGKGKTTASIGLAIRAFGASRRVFIAQFAKSGESSEIKTIRERLPEITVKQYGLDHFIKDKPTAGDIYVAGIGLAEIKDVIASCEYDIVILDEINIALYYNLFAVKDVIDVILNRPSGMEVIITGRNAPEELVEIADLVTEMNEIKHYYSKGVAARKGIEY